LQCDQYEKHTLGLPYIDQTHTHHNNVQQGPQEAFETFQAIGTGVIKIIDNNQDTMHFLALYTPLSTGTIISPNRYTTDNQHLLKKWILRGLELGKGLMTYINKNNKAKSQINMKRSKDGRWYVHNPILIPTQT
jgi:hypothetical protein